MPEQTERFRKVPAAALQLAGGTCALVEADDQGKTAKVKLLARSSKPIEHFYWGKVIHDFAGMTMHKKRLPLDYAHASGEVLGYVNHPNVTPEGLELEGVMTPFSTQDRASEVLFKMREGVPYEASINFGGTGIRVQELQSGELAEVNGATVEGPAAIIRKWPLRGVAVCPYGADHNTSTQTAFAADGEVTVEYIHKPEHKETEMSTKSDKTEVPKIETPAAPPVPPAAELAQPPPVAPVVPSPSTVATPPDPRAEFARMVKDFGVATAAKVFAEGGSYEDAKTAHIKALEAQVAALAQTKEMNGGTDPIPRGTDAPAAGKTFDVAAAVNAKVAAGLSRATAWAQVATEQPEAHAAYIAAAQRK